MPDQPKASAILELIVRNHPGTLSHIAGLFARRAFNLESVFIVPLAGGESSRVLLQVLDLPKLDQIERQLARLYDVVSVRHRPDLDPELFARLMNSVGSAAPAA
jgi:acetolactate synthase-1/3 small subunit